MSKAQYIDSGISRFINHEYIGKFDKYARMCSFVVDGDIENIITGTKDRIKQYHNIKIVNKIICDFKFSFSSTHSKIDKNTLLIHHLFFDMSCPKISLQ